jgi:hypothetical protein
VLVETSGEAPSGPWRVALPALENPELRLGAGTGSWTVTGRHGDESHEFSGRVGESSPPRSKSRRVPAFARFDRPVDEAGRGLAVTMGRVPRGRLRLWLASRRSFSLAPSALWLTGPFEPHALGATVLDPDCAWAAGAMSLVCSGAHVSETFFWRVTFKGGQAALRPIVRVDASMRAEAFDPPDRLAVWYRTRPAVINLRTRKGAWLSESFPRAIGGSLALGPSGLLVLEAGGGSTELSLYRLGE